MAGKKPLHFFTSNFFVYTDCGTHAMHIVPVPSRYFNGTDCQDNKSLAAQWSKKDDKYNRSTGEDGRGNDGGGEVVIAGEGQTKCTNDLTKP